MMLDALENALERERRFVYDASHELRTPLTLLKTRVQLALRRPRAVAEHEQVLAEIQTDLVRLTQLAEHLLAVGAPPALETETEPTDLAALAEHEVARRTALASDQILQLTVRGPVDVALAGGPVTQLLTNLLDNAALHGRPPIAVSVDVVEGAGRLVVVDQGEGMGPDMLATAIHRFSRSEASRSRPGFGLGLSLVEAIVSRAGGELRLCYVGTHQRFGHGYPIPCQHDEAMTVTVLLPEAARAPQPVPSGG
jgi:two-component system OmpR family sensor kinase